VAPCLVYCVSRIPFRMSLAMDVRCATYSVRLNVTKYRSKAEVSAAKCLQGQETVFFYAVSRSELGRTQRRIRWVSGTFTPGVKW